MKISLICFTIMLSASAGAGQTNAPTTPADVPFRAHAARKPPAVVAGLRELKPNEVASGKHTLSGIVVQATKPGNRLQLINPAAPPQYGSPEDNVVRESINGNVVGLKLFAVRF